MTFENYSPTVNEDVQDEKYAYPELPIGYYWFAAWVTNVENGYTYRYFKVAITRHKFDVTSWARKRVPCTHFIGFPKTLFRHQVGVDYTFPNQPELEINRAVREAVWALEREIKWQKDEKERANKRAEIKHKFSRFET